MALDNKIKTGDYDNFNVAQESADKEVKSLDEQKGVIQGYKTSLDNESVFAGPACDACIKELDNLTSKITLDAENFNTIKSYLDSALNNYLDADKKAEKYLDIKDGKVVVTDTPGSNYKSTNLIGNTNKDKIYNYFKNKGFNDIGIAAIMGNLEQESTFSPSNVQNNMGYSDEDYVNGIKNGTISRESFINDGRGFGIAQWTYPSRKANLYDTLGPENIDSLDGQLNFMYDEMGEGMRNKMQTADNINSATTDFHDSYERSADKSMATRQGNAQAIYKEYK